VAFVVVELVAVRALVETLLAIREVMLPIAEVRVAMIPVLALISVVEARPET